MLDLPPETPAIVVTASRAADDAGQSPASVTLIDAARIERLGAPLVPDLLRLVPSVAVAVGGPAGSLTQVRIRGAEANHTLLFVEGIAANDPAAGNEPRFELLNADLASRIEVVRGPQSALWGSEAIGGVVAVSGAAPGSGGTLGLIEYGSADTARAAARTSLGDADHGLSIGIAGQRSDGIDSFSGAGAGNGERDGYRNLGLRGAGRYRLSPALLLGGSGFAFAGTSQFDGYDPATFARADTLDETRNRLAAGRLFADIGRRDARYASLVASLLGSSNRNSVGDDPVNRTWATRRIVAAEAGQVFGRHQLIAALEGERETFKSRDDAYGGSPENRVRLMREVMERLIEIWGADRVAIRLSPNGESQGADDSDPPAIFGEAARVLEQLGVAFVELREMSPEGTFGATNVPKQGPLIRSLFKGPLVLNQEYDAASAEQAMDDGLCDAISFGRPYISNPDLAERIAAGAEWSPNINAPKSWYSPGPAGYTDYSTMDRVAMDQPLAAAAD